MNEPLAKGTKSTEWYLTTGVAVVGLGALLAALSMCIEAKAYQTGTVVFAAVGTVLLMVVAWSYPSSRGRAKAAAHSPQAVTRVTAGKLGP